MFDSIFTVVIATVIAIVYSTVRHKFQGVGLLVRPSPSSSLQKLIVCFPQWLIICLYGWAGTLVAYIAATIIKSPLGAFALAVFLQAIVFIVRPDAITHSSYQF